jgi:5-methylcytosine-specific restriction protein B
MPKRNGSVDSLIGGFKMYDEICKVVAADESLKEMLQKALTPSCYPDPEMRTATIDIGFYLARFYLEERKSEQEEAEWFPKDYSPNISVDEWVNRYVNLIFIIGVSYAQYMRNHMFTSYYF